MKEIVVEDRQINCYKLISCKCLASGVKVSV